MSEQEPVETLGTQIAVLRIGGKLRGRRARNLGAQLEDLAAGGRTRVVLDLRELESMDSLAAFSMELGLEAGLRLHLVVGPGFESERNLSRGLRRTVRIHDDFELALASLRQVVDSGFLAV